METTLCTAMLLSMFLFNSIGGARFQELTWLIETSIKDKEPEWRLVAKEAESRSTIYRWKSGQENILAQVFSAESEQAASDMLHKFAMRFAVPPKARPKDLGEEALLFQRGNASGGTILFKKSNVFVHINGSSIVNARRFALHILDLIETK